MKKWLFNPFRYVAGGKALGIGFIAMVAAAVAGYATSTHFDGVLHMSPGWNTPLWVFMAEQLTCWLLATLVLFAGASIFSPSKTRLIDMAGTQALARWPAIVIAALGACIETPKALTPDALAEAITPLSIICLVLTLTFVVWMVALFYNAFRVSSNMKGGKGVAVFVTGLLLADALSRIVLSQLYKFA